MTFLVSWGPGGQGGSRRATPTHRPDGGHDDAQDVGHNVHQHPGPLELPDHSVQRGFLRTHPVYLFVPKGSKSAQGEKGPYLPTCCLKPLAWTRLASVRPRPTTLPQQRWLQMSSPNAPWFPDVVAGMCEGQEAKL